MSIQDEESTDYTSEQCTPIFPDLKGKRVIVTGGSAGIGKATALAFSKNGAIVTIMARTLQKLQSTVNEFPNKGYYVSMDLKNLEDIKNAVNEAIQKMGGLDILINNGTATNQDAIQQKPTDVESLKHMLDLHVISNMQFIDSCKDELIKNKGVVVNVSSAASQVIKPDIIPYSIAKGAQDTMTRCMALYLSQEGVRVNSVNPAYVDTQVIQKFADELGTTKKEIFQSFKNVSPLKSYTHAWEQANIILFLCSNCTAGAITGNSIFSDGAANLTRWVNWDLNTNKSETPTQ